MLAVLPSTGCRLLRPRRNFAGVYRFSLEPHPLNLAIPRSTYRWRSLRRRPLVVAAIEVIIYFSSANDKSVSNNDYSLSSANHFAACYLVSAVHFLAGDDPAAANASDDAAGEQGIFDMDSDMDGPPPANA